MFCRLKVSSFHGHAEEPEELDHQRHQRGPSQEDPQPADQSGAAFCVRASPVHQLHLIRETSQDFWTICADDDTKPRSSDGFFHICLQKAVVQSRQFPFRFLSAYKVIMELRAEGKTHPAAPTLFQLTD